MTGLIIKIFSKLAKWLQPKHNIKYSDELPDELKRHTIYLIGLHEKPWLITFKCPCGCNSDIQLNLLEDAFPRWKYNLRKKNSIDISPSINRIKGCHSHFFVRKGKIDWVSK